MKQETTKKLKAIGFRIAYGLIGRGIFQIELRDNFNATGGLMTLSFMFLVPFVIGIIAAYQLDHITSGRKIVVSLMSIFTIVAFIGTTLFLGKEGIICGLMALPIFAFMSLVGGFLGVRIFKRRQDKRLLSAFLLLPFIVAPLEKLITANEKVFNEKTTLVINASESEVWKHITRVKEIKPEENKVSLFQFHGLSTTH